ncbi:TonB-dependent receptor domain-containing protein [Winogradskyella eximia]|uniref:TonB-dependent receptor domain-containing protein n=1 Tax=Winogradskyella eximia TaxID=262006 RepID=UPI0024908413|nr:TonB-dependent receptor [Winogradskyella eximia]
MRLIYFFVLMLLPLLAFSQEEAFYIQFTDEDIRDVFTKIEDKYNVLFSYKDEDLSKNRITIKREKRTLLEVLAAIKDVTDLNYKVLNNRYVIINQNSEKDVDFNALDKVVIRSYLTKGIKKNSDGSYNIQPVKLGILPGLTEPDVLESIQLLPGVLSPNETATSFFVRGGASDQNRLIWDGITIYHKGHLFGMISPLNPNVTSEIKFINKGAHARYGERLSSVIDVSSRTDISNETTAELGFNGISADALLDIPIIKDKLNIQASYRRSYMDVFETVTFNQLADKVFESTKIKDIENGNNDFLFSDYNVKLNYKPNKKNRLYASVISIENQLDYSVNDSENNTSYTDRLMTTNTGYGLGWGIDWSKKISQTTTAFFSDYKLNYNFITKENNEQTSDFEKRNTIYDSGISSELRINVSENSNVTFGYQYTLKDVAYAFLNTTNLVFVLDTEDNIVQTHSLFGSYDYSNPELIDVSVGLRASYFEELDAVRLEPRLQVFKSIVENLKFQATAEIKNQIISEIDETILSDLSLENRVWRLADGSGFPIINSQQVSSGFIYNKQGFSIDVDAYFKKLKNITALSLGFLNPESNNFNIGKQRVFGVDAFVKKRFNGFTSWLSYSFNRSKSNFDNLNDDRDFTSKSNVTHAVSSAVSYKLNGFQLALGWKWQTGKPYTISQQDGDGLVFNEGINTGELPNYHRLDFSSTYSFKFSEQNKLKGKVGFSVRNIYNRKNLISREYSGNNSLNDPVKLIEKYALGITPNLMFRVYW